MTHKQENKEAVEGSTSGLTKLDDKYYPIELVSESRSLGAVNVGGSIWTELDYDEVIGPEIALIEFNDAMGLPVNNQPTRLSFEDVDHRLGVIWEELNELEHDLLTADSKAEDTLKEFADVLYTVYSLAVATGFWPYLEEAFYRVHESNMTKISPDTGQVEYKDGKVLKGPNYKPPNFDDMNVKYSDEN